MSPTLCPACGRRPSQRNALSYTGLEGPSLSRCEDPIHDLADRAPELQAEARTPFEVEGYSALDHAMEILRGCIPKYTGEQAQAVAKVLAQWQRKWAQAVDSMGNAQDRQLAAEARVREVEAEAVLAEQETLEIELRRTAAEARCAEMRAALEEIAGVNPQHYDPQAASPEPEDIAAQMRDTARAALEEKA